MCQAYWPVSAFWKDKTRSDGYTSLCKNHHSAFMAVYWKQIYYPRHRQKLIQAVQRRRAEHK